MNSQNFSTEPDPPQGLDAVLPPGHHRAATPEPKTDDDAAHPVDQIAIRKLGGFNLILPEEWSGMGSDDRRDLIKGGLVTFLFEGVEVPLKAALLGLKRQQELRAQANQTDRSRMGSTQPAPRPAES